MTPEAPKKDDPTSAADVMKLVQDQLTEERAAKSALEARAIGVITSSGALTTLMFAIPALATMANSTYKLPDPARFILLITLAAFVVAAISALMASRPGTYREVSVESLRAASTADAMGAPAKEGEPTIADALIDIIERARQNNDRKGRQLRTAVTWEVAATILLAIAVAIVLWVGSPNPIAPAT